MANQNWPFGLQAVARRGGGTPVVRYQTINAVASAIYKGQPLKSHSGTGTVAEYTNVASFNACGTDANCAGVAAEYFPGTGAGSTKTKIAVWDPRENLFEVQVGSGATTSTTRASYLWKHCTLATHNGGSTATGISSGYVTFAGLGVTGGTKPLQIEDVSRDINNCDVDAAYCNVLVRIIPTACAMLH